uniref:Uncharacterized protein n=1 Tax=Davidia involucrata TaxID=16924 RepID=A0A5B7C0S0_DAVIN
MSLKPSFGRKLNPDGFSPVDLALQNGHHQTVKRLIEIDSDLLRVQGKGRIAPLHYVAKTGDFQLLAEFLLACPASIHDLTIQRQTAVHIAVTNRRFAAFRVLLAWLQWEDKEYVLSWKDEEGNTVLHIAAKTNQPQVARLLTNTVNVNAMNLMGLTALDLVDRLPNENQVMTSEITNILLRNKAKRVSSLAKVDSTVADIITLKWPFYPKCARTFFFCNGTAIVQRHA